MQDSCKYNEIENTLLIIKKKEHKKHGSINELHKNVGNFGVGATFCQWGNGRSYICVYFIKKLI